MSQVTYLNQLQTRKRELQLFGYESLSRNIFIRDTHVIVLKGVVKTTNIRELNSLSITKDMYHTLKHKNISIEVFSRNCYRSEKVEKYHFDVTSLIPTGSFRSKKFKTYRYLLNRVNTIKIPTNQDFQFISQKIA